MIKESKIIVLTGGLSEEREVSLRSGKKVFEALEKSGYKNIELFDIENPGLLNDLFEKHRKENYDLAILTTHGKFGEDGCLQGFLEIIGLNYTGSKHMQSAICMDKVQTKRILAANSLPVLESYQSTSNLVENEYIIKPNTEGSSVGIKKFDTKKALQDFIKENSINLNDHLIERFVHGTELTASIIKYDLKTNPLDIKLNEYSDYMVNKKSEHLISLPLLELRPKNEFYDYESKYTAGMTDFILPTELGLNLQKKIHEIALQAYDCLGLDGLARVDFLVDKASRDPFILEVNTLPGMTDLSDSPAQAKAAAISYESLIEMLILSAQPQQKSKLQN